MRSAIVQAPIDAAALLKEVSRTGNGATVLFLGTVRDVADGAPVTALDYSAYGPMAERELADIVAEASRHWDTRDIVVEHRIGSLALGDVSVAIAVAHPHRGEAYAASRYVIEELKKRLPVWKREHYADGRAEWTANREPWPGEPGVVATSSAAAAARSTGVAALSGGAAPSTGGADTSADGVGRSSGSGATPQDRLDKSSGSAAMSASGMDKSSGSAATSAGGVDKSSGSTGTSAARSVVPTESGGRRVRQREHADGK